MSKVQLHAASPAESARIAGFLESVGIQHAEGSVDASALEGKVSAEVLARGSVTLDELRSAFQVVGARPSDTAMAAEFQRQKQLTLQAVEGGAREVSALLQDWALKLGTFGPPSRAELVRTTARVASLEKSLKSLGTQSLSTILHHADFVMVREALTSLSRAHANFGKALSGWARQHPGEIGQAVAGVQDLTRAVLSALGASPTFRAPGELSTFESKKQWLQSQSPDGRLGRFEQLGAAYLWRPFQVPRSDPLWDQKLRLFVMGDQFTGFDDGVAHHLGWTQVAGSDGAVLGWVSPLSARDGKFSAQEWLAPAREALASGGDGLPKPVEMARRILEGSAFQGSQDTVDMYFRFATQDAVQAFASALGLRERLGDLPLPVQQLLHRYDPPRPSDSAGEARAAHEGERRGLIQRLLESWFGIGKLSAPQIAAATDFLSYVDSARTRLHHEFEAALAALPPEVLAEHLAYRDTPAGAVSPASRQVVTMLERMGRDVAQGFADDLQRTWRGTRSLALTTARFAGAIDGVSTIRHATLMGAVDAVVAQLNQVSPSGTDERILEHFSRRYGDGSIGAAVIDLIRATYRGEYPKQIGATAILAHSGYTPVESKDQSATTDDPRIKALRVAIQAGGGVPKMDGRKIERERLAAIVNDLGAAIIAFHNESFGLTQSLRLPAAGLTPKAQADFEQGLRDLRIRSFHARPGDEIRALLVPATNTLSAEMRSRLLKAAELADATIQERKAQLEDFDNPLAKAVQSGDTAEASKLADRIFHEPTYQTHYWAAFSACSEAFAHLLHAP